jgi:hypothetical protein
MAETFETFYSSRLRIAAPVGVVHEHKQKNFVGFCAAQSTQKRAGSSRGFRRVLSIARFVP